MQWINFRISLTIIIVGMVLQACKVTKEIPAINFEPESYFPEAIEMAKKKDMLIFLDFYNEKCIPCKMLDDGPFKDQGIITTVNENYISIKIDTDTNYGKRLNHKFKVWQLPTLQVINPDSEILSELYGRITHDQIVALLEEHLVEKLE